MDLTTTISPKGFSIALCKRPLNLYQYLPLHSSHVPGITRAFITGLIHQTLQLTIHASNQKSVLYLLFTWLCIHGHKPHGLKSLFLATIKQHNPSQPLATLDSEQDPTSPSNCTFLHVLYHPCDPPWQFLQCVFLDTLLHPPEACPLPTLYNFEDAPLNIDRLVVVYH